MDVLGAGVHEVDHGIFHKGVEITASVFYFCFCFLHRCSTAGMAKLAMAFGEATEPNMHCRRARAGEGGIPYVECLLHAAQRRYVMGAS